jgi:hypothetical protein
MLFIADECKLFANSSFQMSVNLFAEKILHQACYNHTSFFFLKDNCIGRSNCSARSLVSLKKSPQEDDEDLRMLLEGEALQQAWSFGEKLQICNKN